ncbi:MAG: terminase small subunit, partial [Oscillospiraceae bacterium]|nr:terminase small subunit [Oscillospiraceae bacterium]
TNDALKLIFFDEMPPLDVLEGLNMFNISDLKRPKGGGMELKFFDRFEALQRLEAMDGATESTAAAQAFYDAIGRGGEG